MVKLISIGKTYKASLNRLFCIFANNTSESPYLQRFFCVQFNLSEEKMEFLYLNLLYQKCYWQNNIF